MRSFRLVLCMVALLVGVGALGGCVSTGAFWDHPVVLASDLTPSALDGQWEGSWQSYGFMDNGLIHLTIIPTDMATGSAATMPAVESPAAPGTQRFLAKVKKWHYGIFAPEEFEMVLIATPGVDGQIQFSGSRDLGPLKGACRYNGFVDSSKAVMWFVNRQDFGSVALRRVVNVVK